MSHNDDPAVSGCRAAAIHDQEPVRGLGRAGLDELTTAKSCPLGTPKCAGLVVGIKTGAGLAAKLPFADHLDDQPGRVVRRLVRVGVKGVPDRL